MIIDTRPDTRVECRNIWVVLMYGWAQLILLSVVELHIGLQGAWTYYLFCPASNKWWFWNEIQFFSCHKKTSRQKLHIQTCYRKNMHLRLRHEFWFCTHGIQTRDIQQFFFSSQKFEDWTLRIQHCDTRFLPLGVTVNSRFSCLVTLAETDKFQVVCFEDLLGAFGRPIKNIK